MRMLDLFAGELGWAKAFLALGWECVAVDLVRPSEIPDGIEFYQADVRTLRWRDGGFQVIDLDGNPRFLGAFDFGCASSPCENFSLFGMSMFHPDPPYPEMGIELFNHTRAEFERAGIPYLMENVRAAEKFVGAATGHCGPFYLWGKGVPVLLPQGIKKGMKLGGSIKFGQLPIEERRKHRTQDLMLMAGHGSKKRKEWTSKVATIPPELAGCVADYAERIIEHSPRPDAQAAPQRSGKALYKKELMTDKNFSEASPEPGQPFSYTCLRSW